MGLQKDISKSELFNLAFGTIIGVGWITVLGTLLGAGGSLGAVLAFLSGGLLICLVGLCYAEIASLYPRSGGEVIYAREILGPGPAFAVGWLLVLIYVAVMAFEAISVGWILSYLIDDVSGPVVYRLLGAPVTAGSLAVGLAGMFALGALNYSGARVTAWVQSAMTYTLLAASVTFIGAGLWRGEFANLRPFFAGDGTLSDAISSVLAVLATAPFWFAGFNVLPQALGEKSENVSARLSGLIILLSLIGAIIFYCLVIIAAAIAVPRSKLLGFDLPAAAAFEAAFNSVLMGKVVLVAGLLGLLTTWNAVFFAAARVLFALGELQLAPSIFARVDRRCGTPIVALIAIGVVASFLVTLGKGAVYPIVSTVGTAFSVVFFSVVLGFLMLRHRRPDMVRPFKVVAGRWVGGAAMVVSIAMFCLSLREQLLGAKGSFPLEWWIFLTWAVLGVGVYAMSKRQTLNVALGK